MLKGETEMNLFGKKFALVLALIAVLAMAGSALAKDIYVEAGKTGGDGSKDSPYGTISEAVTNAQNGDIINVSAGRYEVKGIQITVPVTLKGAGADATIFYAELADSWFDKMLTLGDANGPEYGANIAGTKITDIGFECTAADDVMDAAMIYITGKGTADNNITIENCSFTGKPDNGQTGAIAVLTPWGDGAEYIAIKNNAINNVKHGVFLNNIKNVEITSNDIDGTTHNGININNGDASDNITISGNTLNNISTTTEETLLGEDYGINISPKTDGSIPTNTVTNNEVNMATPEKQTEKAFRDETIAQVAQVTITDADGNERNIYHSTLTEAVQSEKTADGSTVTLLAQPTDEDANVKIDGSITIDPGEFEYTPVVDEGVEVVENEDGTITIVQPSPEPTPEPSHSSGGGGCSAGFGALALLAAVPLMFRRKK